MKKIHNKIIYIIILIIIIIILIELLKKNEKIKEKYENYVFNPFETNYNTNYNINSSMNELEKVKTEIKRNSEKVEEEIKKKIYMNMNTYILNVEYNSTKNSLREEIKGKGYIYKSLFVNFNGTILLNKIINKIEATDINKNKISEIQITKNKTTTFTLNQHKKLYNYIINYYSTSPQIIIIKTENETNKETNYYIEKRSSNEIENIIKKEKKIKNVKTDNDEIINYLKYKKDSTKTSTNKKELITDNYKNNYAIFIDSNEGKTLIGIISYNNKENNIETYNIMLIEKLKDEIITIMISLLQFNN